MPVNQMSDLIAARRERFVLMRARFMAHTRPIVTFSIYLELLVSLCLIGCDTSSPGDDASHHKHHAHIHQRPTFAESVAEIRRRSARFTSNQDSTDAALQEWKKQKLLELIRQLPDLAADTDLKKKEWDRVNAITKGLLGVLQPGVAASRNGLLNDATRFAELVGELEKTVTLDESTEFQ